jgi:hypothetical protein
VLFKSIIATIKKLNNKATMFSKRLEHLIPDDIKRSIKRVSEMRYKETHVYTYKNVKSGELMTLSSTRESSHPDIKMPEPKESICNVDFDKVNEPGCEPQIWKLVKVDKSRNF